MFNGFVDLMHVRAHQIFSCVFNSFGFIHARVLIVVGSDLKSVSQSCFHCIEASRELFGIICMSLERSSTVVLILVIPKPIAICES